MDDDIGQDSFERNWTILHERKNKQQQLYCEFDQSLESNSSIPLYASAIECHLTPWFLRFLDRDELL